MIGVWWGKQIVVFCCGVCLAISKIYVAANPLVGAVLVMLGRSETKFFILGSVYVS